SITIASLLSTRRKKIDACLLKLAFQATIYSLWRERNSRRHQGHPQSVDHLVCMIDKLIKNKISSLRYPRPSFYGDMMHRWMGRTT
ncbi:unnamed protein product, partial [Brassica rapa]